MTPTETATRPRVEGERELEILEATLEVLDEVGYDLLTMDAVATRAKASKATLYRRWKGKPELVVAAIMAHKGDAVVPDTGSLRGDLIAAYCGGNGGLDDRMAQSVLSAVVTAMGRDPEFAEVYRLRPGAFAVYPMYRGLARLVGMTIHPPGADLAGQLAALRRHWDDADFFFVHYKSPDAAGEDGDFDRKVACIEELDRAIPAMMDLRPDVLIVPLRAFQGRTEMVAFGEAVDRLSQQSG